MRRIDAKPLINIWLLAVVAFLAAAVIWPLISFFAKNSERSAQVMREAVERALVQCYALEGSFPPDLYYLSRHYGLNLDEDNYIYHYELIASNIKPEVRVVPK